MNPLLRADYLIFWGLLTALTGVWLSWRSAHRCPRRLRVIAAVVRGLGLAALFVIALNLGDWVAPPSSVAARCAVLLDCSASMAVPDVDGQSRLAAAKARLGAALAKLETPAETVVFGFSDVLTLLDGPALAALEPRPGPTDVLGAGQAVLNRMNGPDGRLTGIVLISDGRQVVQRGRRDLALRARAANIPIMAIPVGGQVVPSDLAVTSRRPLIVSFGNQRVHVPVEVRNQGMGDVRVTVQLLERTGKEVAAATVEVPNDTTRPTLLELPPQPGGYVEYDVAIPQWERESRSANNRDRVGIMTLDSQLRVLLIEGTPYWDSKFLSQLLRRQAGIKVTAIYRLAAERFFRVETSTEEARQISESTFPDTLDELESYDAVIFGKGVEYFLTPARVQLLHRYLADGGGCVLFSRGKPYVGSFDELARIEPVTWGAAITEPVRLQPSDIGVHAGLFGGMLPGPGDAVWQTLPAMSGATQVQRVHGFGQVLAVSRNEAMPAGRTIPALVSRRIGAGLVLLMNGDGLWEWDFAPEAEAASAFYKEFWIQLLYWVATYRDFLPGQAFALKVEPAAVSVGEPIHAVAAARGSNATNLPAVVVARDGAQAGTLALTALPGEARWDGYLALDEPGTYTAELIDAATRAPLGPRTAVEVLPPASERDNLSADPAFLAALAEEAGGAVFDLEDVGDALAKALPETGQAAAQGRSIWRPAWDRWWWLVFVVGLFGLEWVIRRRSGML